MHRMSIFRSMFRFIASPVGTHWYHSHAGTQRTMGAYGPLIVMKRPQVQQDKV